MNITPNDEDLRVVNEDTIVSAGEFHFCEAQWTCDKHGNTNAVLHIRIHQDAPDITYCVECLCDAIEKLGCKPIKPREL